MLLREVNENEQLPTAQQHATSTSLVCHAEQSCEWSKQSPTRTWKATASVELSNLELSVQNIYPNEP